MIEFYHALKGMHCPLVILMIHHLTGGQWGWALRGVATAAARTLPWLALLFLPLVLGLHDLYPWANWPADQIAGSQILSQKALYLNVPFFLVRAGAYFALWLVFGLLVLRWQERVPDLADSPEARRLRTLCGPGLVAYGLGATFAAFDWVMSLEPFWYSTIFGAMFATGQVLSAFAFAIAALLFLARPEELEGVITHKHLRDLGSLLLAFVMLWAYLNFSQYLLIYSGNLPEETRWYRHRLVGGWDFVALLLVLLHFVLPFLLLLSRDVKQRPRALASVAALLLVMRLVDRYWMIVPAFAPWKGLRLHWMDVAALVGVGGVWAALFLRELRRRPLLPAPVPGGEANHHG